MVVDVVVRKDGPFEEAMPGDQHSLAIVLCYKSFWIKGELETQAFILSLCQWKLPLKLEVA